MRGRVGALVVALAIVPRPARAEDGAAPAPDPTAPVRLGFRLRVTPPYLSLTVVTNASAAFVWEPKDSVGPS